MRLIWCYIDLTNKDMDINKMHELGLAARHKKALKEEDYETCKRINEEVKRRIENRTINKKLMNSFRYWNPKTQQFEGDAKYNDLNGLFDNYDNSI